MIYMAVALYYEAKPLIQYLGLKKNNELDKFQVFQNEKVVLVVTGSGEINGAVAVTYLCTVCPVTAGDLFVNFGICAARVSISSGRLYLIEFIEQKTTGRRFYPDLLFDHDFDRSGLVTLPVPAVCADDMSAPLADMEAAGLYGAASLFFSQERLLFFKAVFDHPGQAGDEPITPAAVTAVCEKCIYKMWNFLERIAKASGGSPTVALGCGPEVVSGRGPEVASAGMDEWERGVDLLARQLNATEAMTKKVRGYLRYRQLSSNDAAAYAADFIQRYQVPQCRSKKEAIVWLDKLRSDLIDRC